MSFRKLKKAIEGLKDDVRELRVIRRPGVLTSVRPDGVTQVPIDGGQTQPANNRKVVAVWG